MEKIIFPRGDCEWSTEKYCRRPECNVSECYVDLCRTDIILNVTPHEHWAIAGDELPLDLSTDHLVWDVSDSCG
jgi:hypothetical protein